MKTGSNFTGIGSLPHHNVDTAMDFSFRMGIPFLPQIPLRNPWEYMIAQALEGLPGLQAESDGSVTISPDIWFSRAKDFGDRLNRAFERGASQPGEAYTEFEPSAASSSCWQPFTWELQERGSAYAKIQVAGPMTAQWAIRLRDGSSLDKQPDLSSQIYKLVLARALAMCSRLKASGVQPLLYLDEPGLYGLNLTNPKHVLAIQELKLMVQTLRKHSVPVGLHCCSNTDWSAVLGLGLDYLSIDAGLSLESLLSAQHSPSLDRYLREGGRLSLGIVDTRSRSAQNPAFSSQAHAFDSTKPAEILAKILDLFAAAGSPWTSEPARIRQILSQAIYTPACGLAFHSIPDAESTLEVLSEFCSYLRETLPAGG